MSQGGYGGGNPGGGGPPGGAPPGGGYGPPPGGGYGQPSGAGYGRPAPQAQPLWTAALRPAAERGFVSALFDFSFSSFITTKLIKVIYGLLILVSVVAAVGMFISGIGQCLERYGNTAVGILMIVLSPLAAVLYVILARLYCEIIVVLFRIAETLRDINRKTRE